MLTFLVILIYSFLQKQKTQIGMVKLIICCVVIIVTAALSGAETRIAQHRTTLFHKTEQLPLWWPNEKMISLTRATCQFLLVIVTFAYCVIVVEEGNPLYIINFAVVFVVLWIIGKLIGIWYASCIIKIKGKRNNTRILHECL